MEDHDVILKALRALIVKALEQCTDADLLDLIYKLLTNSL